MVWLARKRSVVSKPGYDSLARCLLDFCCSFFHERTGMDELLAA